jgi:hypothetical protein
MSSLPEQDVYKSIQAQLIKGTLESSFLAQEKE